ncbi:MAG: cytochrome ubiquinol oxidase subunit I [Chloroflexi bacterium]|jgi:cytochrome d ubiquinol oxidase subunit I|nr:MAG: cytochrome ubiquinol oxidase subunit I [Chloroflexota bacterium]
MDPLLLSRWQFAITTIYHFFLVPLTLGLSILVAIFESRYVATGNETYKRLTKFWGKIFLINFAAGVVTGIVQEFHFGMNWSGYARFMGDIFGAPLAIEALLAFYMESTFIGLWVFGWDKLSKKMHLAAAWLVAIGSSISAFWILIANSFMQNPVGYAIENGRAVMTSFLALVTNPNLPYQFLHVLAAGITTAGFVVLGFSAWHLLKDKKGDIEFFQIAFKWAAAYALIGAVMVGLVGDAHGKYLGKHQPMKIAAAEAIWDTADPADFVVVAAIDEEAGKNGFEIRVPNALSFLLYNRFTGEVKGLNELQEEAKAQYGDGNYIPPVALTFWSFRIMVGVGTLMVLLAFLAVVRPKVKFLNKSPLFLKALFLAMVLPYLASTFGWILTEEARQPWIVYGLQKVEEAVSPNLSAGTVLFSLILFTLLLGATVAVTGWLMYKYGTSDPKAEKAAEY